MLTVPKFDKASVVFGDISHMPKYEALPKEFQEWQSHQACKSISSWFFAGCEPIDKGIKIKDIEYTVKEGLKADDAIAAIRAVMCSWAPKHEHKVAACGYMLNEWFDAKKCVK